MLSWRKRKPQEEEPLVPHGLIWQATEESMPSGAENLSPGTVPDATGNNPSPAAHLPTNDHASSVEPVPILNIGTVASREDAIPEPLPWASLNAKNAVKKSPPPSDDEVFWRRPAKEFPANSNAKDLLATGMSARSDDEPPSDAAKAAGLLLESKAHRNLWRSFLEDCKRELRSARLEASHAVAELWANSKHAYVTWEIRKQIGRARQDAETRIAGLRLNVSQRMTNAAIIGPRHSSAMTGAIVRARGAASQVQRRAVAGFESSKQFARTIAARRVKIRIASAVSMAPVLQRLRHAQLEARLGFQRHSRLATSMAMAGVSALLTLGLILLVGRYEPSANAGTTPVASRPSQQTSLAQPVSFGTAAKRPVSSPRVPVAKAASAKPSAVVSTGLRAPTQPSSSRLAAARSHRNEDDDYVARDTYVYYGSKGKQSR